MTDQEIKILISAETGKASAEIKKLNRDIASLNKQSQDTGKGVKNVEQLTRSFRQLAIHVGKLMVIYGSAKGLITATGLMIEMEDALTDVSKTTNLAGEDLKRFDGKLQEMSKELKGIEYKELLGISATAGQLGIEGSANLLTFTESIARIAVATEYTADEASLQFGKLANATGVPVEGIEALASSVNELSTTTAASVSEIVQVSQKMAGTAKTFGLMAYETTAYAAVMKGLGITTEVAGSSFKKIMGEMLADVEKFAEFSGKSVEEFAEIMNDKPTEALELFFIALSKLDAQDAIKALEDLGLKGLEVSDTALKLSGAIDQTSKALDTSAKGFKENTSIMDEYVVKSKTAKASITSFRSSIQVLVTKLGDSLLPVLASTADGMAEMINNADPATIQEWANGIGEVAKILGDLIVTLASAVGAIGNFVAENKVLILTITELTLAFVATRKISLAIEAFAGVSSIKNMKDFAEAIKAASKAVMTFALANPYLLALGVALAAVMYAVNSYADRIAKLSEQTDKAFKSTESYNKVLRQTETAFVNNAKGIKITEEARTGLITKLNDEAIALSKLIIEQKKESDGSETSKQNIATLERNYEMLVTTISELLKLDVAAELEKQGKASTDASKGIVKISDAYKTLNAEESKRIGVQEGVLGELLVNEQNHLNDLAKLKQAALDIENKYQQERIGLEDDHQNALFNANQKGLNAYEQYKNKRKRIDELIKDGREASEVGDISRAEAYYSEALSLAEGFAGETIEIEKEVQKYNDEKHKWETVKVKEIKATKTATLRDYQQYYKKIHEEQLAIINKKKSAELLANAEKMKLAEFELIATRTQIEATIALIETIGAYFDKLKNGNKGIDTKALKESLKNIDAYIAESKAVREGMEVEAKLLTAKYTTDKTAFDQAFAQEESKTLTTTTELDTGNTIAEHQAWLAKIEADKPQIQIDADNSKAKAKADEILDKIKKDKADLQIVVNDAKLNQELKGVEGDIDSVDTETRPVGLPIDEAQGKLNELESLINQMEGTSTQNLDDSTARSTASALISDLNSMVSSHIHNIYANRVGFSTGGQVTGVGDVPKFADGGFLRRTGKIAGHDLQGSDDVKAMLTRGEFVLPTSAVDHYGVEMLEAMRHKALPRFASGGLIDNSDEDDLVTMFKKFVAPEVTTKDTVVTTPTVASSTQSVLRSTGGSTRPRTVPWNPHNFYAGTSSIFGFATGGHVGSRLTDGRSIPKYADGGQVFGASAAVPSREVRLSFSDNNGEKMDTMTDEATASQLENYFKKYSK